jgi:hypothetical protein
MNPHAKFVRSSIFALLSASAVLAAGCGDDGGLEKRHSVSGTVTYKGAPVKSGRISFVPTKPDGHAASGNIVDGQYYLTTLNPGDGALPGTYKITVDDRELDAAKVKADTDAMAKRTGAVYNAIPQELQAKALKLAKGIVPGKYQIASTSDIEKEVKAESNKIDIELKD